jgi:predicted component of type VI protein secretion system
VTTQQWADRKKTIQWRPWIRRQEASNVLKRVDLNLPAAPKMNPNAGSK